MDNETAANELIEELASDYNISITDCDRLNEKLDVVTDAIEESDDVSRSDEVEIEITATFTASLSVKYLGFKPRGFDEWNSNHSKPRFNSHRLFQRVSTLSAYKHSHTTIP